MPRLMLSDESWSKLEKILLQEVISVAPKLIARLPDAEGIVADKGYDSEHMREQIAKMGARAVVSRKCNSVKGNGGMDWGLYKYRHLVENALLG